MGIRCGCVAVQAAPFLLSIHIRRCNRGAMRHPVLPLHYLKPGAFGLRLGVREMPVGTRSPISKPVALVVNGAEGDLERKRSTSAERGGIAATAELSCGG
jgi:hypothetical protein